ncbi:hypothetical protein SAMN04488007_0198 [Maribacter aquivivus]|uniref:Uncharacterized protein n=1 Tax=Maribacter aquivivus TaxID=228958 RepID=A0A1M6IYY0_9FLAO|nr:hypothetical protein [Maribacter aquivivus]SHJ39600.1 hypothetical protein SAMN04488007_0198 [Maribacter aquivivus]
MKSNLILLVSTLFFLGAYAQDSFKKLPLAAKINCPMLLIDEHIIANRNIITSKEDIEEIAVIKDKPNRETHDFYNLSENGIASVTLKKKIASKTQAELNTFFGLNANNSIYVNGYLIESAKYKFSTESIVEVELVTPTAENKLKQKVINIWTLTQDERVNGCKQ